MPRFPEPARAKASVRRLFGARAFAFAALISLLVAPAVATPSAALADGATPAVATSGPDLCAQVGYTAGFRGTYLVTAVEVGMAESSCNPSATGQNATSYDRGLWQINSYWHSEVTDVCAYNAQCNANAAYRISSGGTNWSQWSTYIHGTYLNYASVAQAAVNRLNTNTTTPSTPFTTLLAADFTGDGKADVAAVDKNGDLWLYPHTPSGFGTPWKIGTGWNGMTALLAADFNGDGNADVVSRDGSGNLWLYPHTPSGFGAPSKIGTGW
jgi:hypothetical protein